ncbi:Nramp family divalent metal transporter [Dyella sp. 2RAB6]|uniref:Nramp family divalent metal transporter n=1 Tax=Dyella sp. 2RAB6 TaxID=3232992 RepID=UPI003F906B3A
MSPDGSVSYLDARIVGTRRRYPLFGAGALVAAGYMDPGNWATAMQGGASFGYRLLWVVLAASLVAMLLQWIACRVGAITGRGLAELCRDELPRRFVLPMWLVAEFAIVACDVAETVGTAVALRLLFGVPLWLGVLLSGVLVLGYFALERPGKARMERVVAISMAGVAACLAAQLTLARLDWPDVFRGLAPSGEVLHTKGGMWLVVGIIGATVMPHNLFLHSALLTRYAASDKRSVSSVLRRAGTDTIICLSFAMLINIGLMLLAAVALQGVSADVGDLAQAQRPLTLALGATWPSLLFAAALLCCGLNSMVSGTLAGQVVMEGFLDIKLSRFRRALLTRGCALGPALVVVQVFGGERSTSLLVGSQVILSLSLPLALIPLIRFACQPRLMGAFELPSAIQSMSWLCASLLVGVNGVLLWQLIHS